MKNCERVGVGGRVSPRAASGAGLPENRLARTLALPVFSQLQVWPVEARRGGTPTATTQALTALSTERGLIFIGFLAAEAA